MSDELMQHHTLFCRSSMDRSYFPSVLKYLAEAYPEAQGRDRDWQVFLSGVDNGAEVSYARFAPIIQDAEGAIASALKSVDVALELSDDLDVPALEHLLAARNRLVAYTQQSWKDFNAALESWFHASVGLQEDTVSSPGPETDNATLLRLIVLARSGDNHPFFAWAYRTRLEGQKVSLSEFARLRLRLFSPGSPVRTVKSVMETRELATLVPQYLTWARDELKAMKQAVIERAGDDLLPTVELATWAAQTYTGIGD